MLAYRSICFICERSPHDEITTNLVTERVLTVYRAIWKFRAKKILRDTVICFVTEQSLNHNNAILTEHNVLPCNTDLTICSRFATRGQRTAMTLTDTSAYRKLLFIRPLICTTDRLSVA